MPLAIDINRSKVATADRSGLREQKEYRLWVCELGYDQYGNDQFFPNLVELVLDANIVQNATTVSLTPDADITLYEGRSLRLGNDRTITVSETVTLDSGVLGVVSIYTYDGPLYNLSSGSKLYSYPMIPLGQINSGGPSSNETAQAEANNVNFGKRTFRKSTRIDKNFDLSGIVNTKDPAYPMIQRAKNDSHVGYHWYFEQTEMWSKTNEEDGVLYYGGQMGTSEYYNSFINVSFTLETDSNLTLQISGPVNDQGAWQLPPAVI